jgi:plastocyanin
MPSEPTGEVVMKRWLVVLSLCVLVTLGVAACGGGDKDSSGGQTSSGTTAKSSSDAGAVITIKNLAFSGASSTTANTQVTVKNEDSTKHTFTPDTAGDFQAAVLEGGQSTSIQFAKAGTFHYHCEIHSSMKGTIEVTG